MRSGFRRVPFGRDYSNRYNNAVRIAGRDFSPELAHLPVVVLRLVEILIPSCANCGRQLSGVFVCSCGAYEHVDLEGAEWGIDAVATRASQRSEPIGALRASELAS